MEEEIFTDWSEKVPMICETNLAKTLLVIHADKSLEVNFDPELTAVLRETRYMLIMQRTDVPDEAKELFNRAQFFFESNYNLSLITQWYNRICKFCSPVELELIQEELNAIDEIIDEGQTNYNWNSTGKE